MQTDSDHSARLLKAEAPEQSLDGQVFWLTARNGPRTTFPRLALGRPLQWSTKVREPRRLQRRPRNGVAPFSLLPLGSAEELWDPSKLREESRDGEPERLALGAENRAYHNRATPLLPLPGTWDKVRTARILRSTCWPFG